MNANVSARSYRCKTLFFLSICLLGFGGVLAQFTHSYKFQPKSKSVVIPFVMRNNLIIIKIKINQSDTLNFVLDTGLRMNLVTDPQIAQSLGLTYTRKMNIIGFGEAEPITAMVSVNNEIDLSGVIGFKQNLVTLSEDKLELSDYVGMPIHGVLGFDLFGSFVVKLDFQSQQITLINPKKYKYRKGHGEKIPILIEDGKPYLMASYSTKENKEIPLKLILDTGAGHGLLLETAGNPEIKLPEFTMDRQLGKGLNGTIFGKEGRIDCFRLGKFNLDQVITSFPDSNSNSSKILKSTHRQGNLGCEVMSRFNIVFNYQQGYVAFKANRRTFKTTFERDMSGMIVSARGKNFDEFIVEKVYVGSPAQNAGIIAGDELLMVDYRMANFLDLSVIHKSFTKGNGKNISLLVRRKNELLKIELTLRRMI